LSVLLPPRFLDKQLGNFINLINAGSLSLLSVAAR
jgi:hypothetical protein